MRVNKALTYIFHLLVLTRQFSYFSLWCGIPESDPIFDRRQNHLFILESPPLFFKWSYEINPVALSNIPSGGHVNQQ